VILDEAGQPILEENSEPILEESEGGEMAAEIIQFDPSKQPAAEVISALRQIRDGRDRLKRARDVMIRYRDGADNAGDPSNYDLLQTACSYAAGDYGTANAAARASFLEIDSCIAKLTTDASVSAVQTAIDQACAKHGV
jgi:hypothetical protein